MLAAAIRDIKSLDARSYEGRVTALEAQRRDRIAKSGGFDELKGFEINV